MNLKAVLFDYGHTLTYFPHGMRSHLAASKNVQRIINNLGVTVDYLTIRALIDRYVWGEKRVVSITEEFREILSTLGVSSYTDEDLQRIIDVHSEPFIKHVRIRKGAKTLLTILQQNKIKLGIVANIYSEAMNPVLEREKLLHFFTTIIASVDVGYRKPDPIIFHLALKQLHLKPQEVIMVGDSPQNDIQGAHNLGIQTVRLMRGPNRTKPDIVKPDYKIWNFSNLLPIIGTL